MFIPGLERRQVLTPITWSGFSTLRASSWANWVAPSCLNCPVTGETLAVPSLPTAAALGMFSHLLCSWGSIIGFGGLGWNLAATPTLRLQA